MTATPEARACRITDAILDLVMVDGENVSASVLHPATDIIAQAIRDAEDAALERATAKAQMRFEAEIQMSAGFSRSGRLIEADKRIAGSAVAQLIAEDITALKHSKETQA